MQQGPPHTPTTGRPPTGSRRGLACFQTPCDLLLRRMGYGQTVVLTVGGVPRFLIVSNALSTLHRPPGATSRNVWSARDQTQKSPPRSSMNRRAAASRSATRVATGRTVPSLPVRPDDALNGPR